MAGVMVPPRPLEPPSSSTSDKKDKKSKKHHKREREDVDTEDEEIENQSVDLRKHRTRYREAKAARDEKENTFLENPEVDTQLANDIGTELEGKMSQDEMPMQEDEETKEKPNSQKLW